MQAKALEGEEDGAKVESAAEVAGDSAQAAQEGPTDMDVDGSVKEEAV